MMPPGASAGWTSWDSAGLRASSGATAAGVRQESVEPPSAAATSAAVRILCFSAGICCGPRPGIMSFLLAGGIARLGQGDVVQEPVEVGHISSLYVDVGQIHLLVPLQEAADEIKRRAGGPGEQVSVPAEEGREIDGVSLPVEVDVVGVVDEAPAGRRAVVGQRRRLQAVIEEWRIAPGATADGEERAGVDRRQQRPQVLLLDLPGRVGLAPDHEVVQAGAAGDLLDAADRVVVGHRLPNEQVVG